jgi:hypothetical protein
MKKGVIQPIKTLTKKKNQRVNQVQTVFQIVRKKLNQVVILHSEIVITANQKQRKKQKQRRARA